MDDTRSLIRPYVNLNPLFRSILKDIILCFGQDVLCFVKVTPCPEILYSFLKSGFYQYKSFVKKKVSSGKSKKIFY